MICNFTKYYPGNKTKEDM